MDLESKRAEIINQMLKASGNGLSAISSQPEIEKERVVPAGKRYPEPIAIIGLSGYFPQSNNVQEFWNAIDTDTCLIEEIHEDRINWKQGEKRYAKRGGLIPDIRQFDPAFFGILPGEASQMDPRKRLLLMAAYHAIEDAGYAPASLRKTATGVFVAIEEDEYSQCMKEAGIDLVAADSPSSSLIANQLSYYFDFTGPSEVVNTMCSGAAVAIHRAVNALRAGEISSAIVGAANIMLTEDPFDFLSATGQISTSGSVNSFGKDAKGFVRADGVACILLKPLSKAVKDNDAVYAVIRNSAVNYNGKGGTSMAAPNINAHTAVIQSCYEEVDIDPRYLGCIETQGMGNPVADIAEWEACNRALKAIARKKNISLKAGACAVSTLKPLTGHMHAASALGALFKIIRSLQTNTLHKIAGLVEINPDLDITGEPCRLMTETCNWPEANFPRLAGLHSYGSGGNNAHLLIEEYNVPHHTAASTAGDGKVIVPFSASTEKQCKIIVEGLLNYLAAHTGHELSSIAYTMQVGRDAMKHRVAFVVSSRKELITLATAYLQGNRPGGEVEAHKGEMATGSPGVENDIYVTAQQWVEGAAVVWNKTAFRQPVRRLHLPLYPFACSEYWISPNKTVAALTLPRNGETRSPLSGQAEQMIRDLLGTFLLKPPAEIDIEKQFSDLGFDSLLVTRLSHSLQQKYNLAINAAMFFEYTTPKQLINFIDRDYKDILQTQPSVNKNDIKAAGKVDSSKGDVADRERQAIAIVGVSGVFPGSPSPDLLWQNLVAGSNCIDEIPADRWSVDTHFHPDAATANSSGKSYGKWGGFIKDFYHFDPLFFNISPQETASISPKERLFLQCSWHVLEDAGYTPQALSEERVGVFAGVTRSGIDPYKTSPFTISNRVSYVLNLTGPSMTIDTACSSSLIAIHEACQHINTGECTVALAGGVHVFLDPSHFAVLSGMYMLSPDGSSKSFGENANGMAPGEGVGVLLLKPLQQAIADQDHIYGVIRGSAINHGGKTNGFTVPNPKAHENVIRSALQKAQVNARDISYVEAHGTGTPLGDPIEIRGLTEAFKKDTSDHGFCRIGSLKSNIGHLEAAAGVSGLIKILLQMKHKKLVPSLHSQNLNPQINFSGTPFRVQQEVEDWQPKDKNGNPVGRLACVSAFGAGGANAHVVVEEYQGEVQPTNSLPGSSATKEPFLFVLSAKNEDRLKEYVRELLTLLNNSKYGEHLQISDLIYTLQVGRMAMEERLAIEIFSLEDLTRKLKYFLEGQVNIENLYRGNTKTGKELLATFTSDREMADSAVDRLSSGDYSILLSSWTKGLPFNWHILYNKIPGGKVRPHRISLPGYPFMKEYYGLPAITISTGSAASPATGVIHPLVHKNTSTFFDQRFSATFTGREFFLKDHVINGEKVLPGVAYLEMVNITMQVAAHNGETAPPVQTSDEVVTVQLKNVAWIQPAVVRNDALKIQVALYAEEAGVSFEISSTAAGETQNNVIHSQGSVSLIDKKPPSVIDIAAIRQAAEFKACLPEACYDAFAEMGIVYGPAHRGIRELYIANGQVLAKLALPELVSDTFSQFRLHPSLLDAAFQSIVGFWVVDKEKYGKTLPLAIPFALEEMTIYDECKEVMWASITINGGIGLTGSNSDFDTLSFNIELIDETGKLCIEMKKYTARVLKQTVGAAGQYETLLLLPSWENDLPAVNSQANRYDERIIITCKESGLAYDAFRAMPGVRTINLASDSNSMDAQLQDYTIQLFEALQLLLKAKPVHKVLIQLIIPADGDRALFNALYALLKTARVENPAICGQLISIENGCSKEEMMTRLNRNVMLSEKQERYSEGYPQKAVLHEYTSPDRDVKAPWKSRGVYLITGGAGGLGLIFARDILEKTTGASVILTGRSAPDERIQQVMAALPVNGGAVEYRQADVTNGIMVKELIWQIEQTYKQLNGIIHCAGVVKDGFIITKDRQRIETVLAPKVKGLVNLDDATKNSPLDIFILCSSSSARRGNAGQGDYAVANAFLDEFALYRNSLVKNNQRHGHMVSISWPLWKSGGMNVDPRTEKMMFEKIGMAPLETSAGLRALYGIINSGCSQMMVMYGNLKRLRAEFLPSASPVNSNKLQTAATVQPGVAKEKQTLETAGEIKDKAVAYFKKLLSKVIKLSFDRIDSDTALEEYGIDSIMVMQMTAELEKVFGSLPKTLFFEYQNISELTNYFIKAYPEAIANLTAVAYKNRNEEDIEPESTASQQHVETVTASREKQKVNRFTISKQRPEESAISHKRADIAVVGLSGRYPQADNLEQFWENLCNGKNSITEIPANRWDHSIYFDRDKNKRWKTNSKWGGFLNGVDEFDPLFFNISPREAEILDPQERLFLQCAYECIEDAGYTRQLLGKNAVEGRVGVYVGVMWTEYQLFGAQETALGRSMALSSSASSIANRVSYYCNFNGPSLALDTMCSSSLTAIHLACQSLQNGECSVAIAGGVNVSIHPNKYLVLGYGKLASSKGMCESFGNGGDGYVPGEGVGAVLLKPLHQAEADGDHIYGIIRGSAINHGGKVNGYAVPNPKAQAKVIRHALAQAGFDPRTISYVEAHGTGTALGDPVEIAGLTGGFNNSGKQFCSIGSVKSNIGHCESAAGIAGITKVLLQMKYRRLVPSLHSTVLNPNIDFANSPFIVQQEAVEWKRPVLEVNGDLKEFPRRAGISSFGAGGANAHILIEEYIPAIAQKSKDANSTSLVNHGPVAIILSAKTEDRLKEVSRQLLSALRNKMYNDADLLNMSYTLQVGREAMEIRVAMEVATVQELEEKLATFVEDEAGMENQYTGKETDYKHVMSLFSSDGDMEKLLDGWLNKKKYQKLLALWVNGLDIDWEKLYAPLPELQHRPKRISLPVYPFLRTRYWPEMVKGDQPGNSHAAKPVIHPLVHQNTSTFAAQKFSSVFTGEEFFLKDHLVNGAKLLPGVAYLEMINEAMVVASGQSRQGILIENISWSQPLMVNGHPEKVDIGLFPVEGGAVQFEISSTPGDNTQQVTHSQGIARYVENAAHPLLDFESIKAHTNDILLDAEGCYQLFSKTGISYGPAQRGVESIRVGNDMLLAKLRLPPVVAGTLDQYFLHPSLMDASLQAVIGFLANQKPGNQEIPLAIPFSIKSVAVLNRCTSQMWAYIRYTNGRGAGQQTTDAMQLTFDIDVCDESGNLCVQIQGFTSRIMRKEAALQTKDILLMKSIWQYKEASYATLPDARLLHYVVLAGNEELTAELRGQFPHTNIMSVPVIGSSIANRFEEYALQVFKVVKQLFSNRLTNKVLMQVVIPAAGETQLLAAIAGLLKTAHFENPGFAGQVIGIGQGETAEGLANILRENFTEKPGAVVRYTRGWREVQQLREYTPVKTAMRPVWKEGGVYVITGGAGGLGIIFSKEIARQEKNATIILTGRSIISKELERRLIELRSVGLHAEYRELDVSDSKQVDELVKNILRDFGQLHGIIHSAGVLRDNFILKKTEQEIKEVFAPKVSGVYNLDIATREIPLDFFLVCSSATGVTGNAGQADYAMANAWLDSFAELRASMVAIKERSGKTLSVNWPLWKEGGMHVSAQNEKMLLENYGMVPLETAPALEVLYQLMAGDAAQVMLVQGDVAKLRTTFLPRIEESIAGNTGLPAHVPESRRTVQSQKPAAGNPNEEILALLKKVLSEVTKLPVNEVGIDKPMDEYGIDSVMITQMTNELEKVFGNLSKTLFFEYRNIRELADYFAAGFAHKFKAIANREQPVELSMPEPVQSSPVSREDKRVSGNDAGIRAISLESAVQYLKNILAEAIKLSPEKVNADKPMDEYGIDSVLVMQMTDALEKRFGNLSKTLFFEYRTIRELSDYFLETFPKEFVIPQAVPSAFGQTALIAPPPEQPRAVFEPVTRFANVAPRVEEKKVNEALDIAVIGMAGRYPQSRNVNEFWQVLRDGKNCVTEIPKDRWDYNLYFNGEKNTLGKSNSKWGAFIDGASEFDPLFFGISAREAEGLDPQERLFLQCAYETLEDAGYSRGTIGSNKETGPGGNVGVYVGVMWNEYQLYGAQETISGRPLSVSGVSASIANRVSYYCDFNGMSITLNTMCSSSLTAIHLACQSIRQGECEAAIAGGVNLNLHPNKYMALGYGGFLSGNGLCESFGAGADGYVPGEGVGAVLLKPLAKAIADNDHIYGVIKGSAVNHGGKTNNFTVPNPKAQAKVIDKAMKMAGFDPGTISYLEAQGTGTSLGDSIEITGLNRAFGTKEKQICPIGSVKSNIGHCESASGIAALTKVLLQMKFRQLAPSLHAKDLNPNIDFRNSSFYVQQELREWKRPVLDINGVVREYPRRAGVSAFGAGGSNAHIMVEEYVPDNSKMAHHTILQPDKPLEQAAIVVLSARNERGLRKKGEQLLTWVKGLHNPPSTLLTDMAYTLQVGREAMKERLAMAVTSFGELEAQLADYLAGERPVGIYTGQVYDTYNTSEDLSLEADAQDAIDQVEIQRNDNILLEAWVKGKVINWRRLYRVRGETGYQPKRIPLPTYPFSTEKYWIPQIETVSPAAPVIHAILPPGSDSKPREYAAPILEIETEFPEIIAKETTPANELLQPVEHTIRGLLAGIVKYGIDQIDIKEPFASYGIDSIMIHMLNKQLVEVYGELPPSLLFDYPTVRLLAAYLATNYANQSTQWTALNAG